MYNHVPFIKVELQWLSQVLTLTNQLNSGQKTSVTSVYEIVPPDAAQFSGPYAQWLKRKNSPFAERLLIILALTPYVQPDLLDTFKVSGGIPTAFGGKVSSTSRAFLPTGETALFLLSEGKLEKRLELMELIHGLKQQNVIQLDRQNTNDSDMNGLLKLSREYRDLFVHGVLRKPDLSPEFPAKLITTEMDWADLVVGSKTRHGLSELEEWLEYFPQLWKDTNFRKHNQPGYRVLFAGPPGTGKTLSACLIGKKTGRDVYRIDLSTVVSKYIGETEKNLARLFDRAENKDWILFFDEADALFGKRTGVSDSNDRYANQEVSFLLQRIEYYSGLVILATNMKQNIDLAFLRRFQSIVNFVRPDASERMMIWQNATPAGFKIANPETLSEIIANYELSGAHIANINARCCLQAAAKGNRIITKSMLKKAIANELEKEGRTL